MGTAAVGQWRSLAGAEFAASATVAAVLDGLDGLLAAAAASVASADDSASD